VVAGLLLDLTFPRVYWFTLTFFEAHAVVRLHVRHGSQDYKADLMCLQSRMNSESRGRKWLKILACREAHGCSCCGEGVPPVDGEYRSFGGSASSSKRGEPDFTVACASIFSPNLSSVILGVAFFGSSPDHVAEFRFGVAFGRQHAPLLLLPQYIPLLGIDSAIFH